MSAREINAITSIFSHFAAIDPKMQLSTALVFLEIAKADLEERPITNRDIEKTLGMKSGTVTRNIYYWTSEGHPANTGTVGYVSVSVSLRDRRRRNIVLTPKGKAYIRSLIDNEYPVDTR
jgi:DNA-binding MarR family transcriptional regulator